MSFRQLSPEDGEKIEPLLVLDSVISLTDRGGYDLALFHHRETGQKYLRVQVKGLPRYNRVFFEHLG